MLNVNDTAFVRTTSEEVFVLAIEGDEAVVRRPVMSQDGIKHVTDRFKAVELDTIESKAMREVAERQMLQKLFAQLNPKGADGTVEKAKEPGLVNFPKQN